MVDWFNEYSKAVEENNKILEVVKLQSSIPDSWKPFFVLDIPRSDYAPTKIFYAHMYLSRVHLAFWDVRKLPNADTLCYAADSFWEAALNKYSHLGEVKVDRTGTLFVQSKLSFVKKVEDVVLNDLVNLIDGSLSLDELKVSEVHNE